MVLRFRVDTSEIPEYVEAENINEALQKVYAEITIIKMER